MPSPKPSPASAVDYAVQATDALAVVSSIVILISVGLLSAALPARRAAHVDPVGSIHAEG